MADARKAVHAFLLDFIEGRARSRQAAEYIEPVVNELASSDERFEELATALARYDGRQGRSEAGLVNQDGLAFTCRQALHDLDDHQHCSHLG